MDRDLFEDGCIVDDALLRWHYFGEVAASSGAALALRAHILDAARDTKQHSDAQLSIERDITSAARSNAVPSTTEVAEQQPLPEAACAARDELRTAVEVIQSACEAVEQSKLELSLSMVASSRAAMLNSAFAATLDSATGNQPESALRGASNPWEILHRHAATNQHPSAEQDDVLSRADVVNLIAFPALIVGYHRSECEVQAFDETALLQWFSQALGSAPMVVKQLHSLNKALVPLIRRFVHHFSAKGGGANAKSLFSPERPENFFAFVHALEQQELRKVLVPGVVELLQRYVDSGDTLIARLHSSSIVSLLADFLSLLLWQHAMEFFVTTWKWHDVCRAVERHEKRRGESERRTFDDDEDERTSPPNATLQAPRSAIPVEHRRFLHYCNCIADVLQSQSFSSSPSCREAKRTIVSDVAFRPNNGRPLRLWCEMLKRNIVRTCEAELSLRTLWRREFLYTKPTETPVAPGVLVKLFRGLRASVDAISHIVPEARNPVFAPAEGIDARVIIWNELIGKTVFEFAQAFDVGSVMTEDLRHQFTSVLEQYSAQLFPTTAMPVQCTAVESLVDALS